MRKRHILALLLALLLLLALSACKKEEQPDTSEPAPESAPQQQTGDEDTVTPELFGVRFEKDGNGFNTWAGILFVGETSTPHDFTADLATLQNYLNEYNAPAIGREHADLTYGALSGNAPSGANATYTVQFAIDGQEYTVKTDDAAIAAYKSTNNNISNIAALIDRFAELISCWNENSAG